MKELDVMVGLPRSGKSTWVNAHKEGKVIISADSFRKLIYGQRYYAEGEGMVWAVRELALKNLMEQGVDIIIDETNTTIAARAKLLKLAKTYGYSANVRWCDVHADTCKARATATGQSDLIPIIDRMNWQFEEPMLAEGFEMIQEV